MPKKLTYEHVKQECLKRYILLLSKEYYHNKQKLEAKCLKCGFYDFSRWSPRYADISQGHGCPRCGNSLKYSIEEVKKILLLYNVELLENNYKNKNTQIKCKCFLCGNISFRTFDNIVNNKEKCYFCTKQSRENNRKQTCLKRFGVENPLQNKFVAMKHAKSLTNSYILYHWKTNEELVCVGSWEKKVVQYLNNNKIQYEWQSKVFKMPNGKTYRPDCYLNDHNLWIEIKGFFKRTEAKLKWDWFHKEYPNSELWDKEKLKEMQLL